MACNDCLQLVSLSISFQPVNIHHVVLAEVQFHHFTPCLLCSSSWTWSSDFIVNDFFYHTITSLNVFKVLQFMRVFRSTIPVISAERVNLLLH